MEISKAEAAEIAAECVASIEYQTNNIALTARSDAMSTADMAAAVTPKKPATLRLIEWMKRDAPFRSMKEVLPQGMAPRVALVSTTCRSIAENLSAQGHDAEAQLIWKALDRGNAAVRPN
jgi:hypothetical protein